MGHHKSLSSAYCMYSTIHYLLFSGCLVSISKHIPSSLRQRCSSIEVKFPGLECAQWSVICLPNLLYAYWYGKDVDGDISSIPQNLFNRLPRTLALSPFLPFHGPYLLSWDLNTLYSTVKIPPNPPPLFTKLSLAIPNLHYFSFQIYSRRNQLDQ